MNHMHDRQRRQNLFILFNYSEQFAKHGGGLEILFKALKGQIIFTTQIAPTPNSYRPIVIH